MTDAKIVRHLPQHSLKRTALVGAPGISKVFQVAGNERWRCRACGRINCSRKCGQFDYFPRPYIHPSTVD